MHDGLRSGLLCGVALLTALGVGRSEAALVEQDSGFGVGTHTLDTATGLVWLDLTESVGLSFDAVVAGLGPGEAFEGYRVATGAEADALFLQGGFEATDNVQRAEDFAEAQAFVALLGANQSSVRGDASTGMVDLAPVDAPDARYVFGAFFGLPPFIEGNTGSANGLDSLTVINNVDNPTVHATWLVVVPEPGSAALLLFGLSALVRRRR